MTSGAKFGGDYLAYPGDPLLYHAQYTVRCLHGSTPLHPLALAAAARMAHAARCVPRLCRAVGAQAEPRRTAGSTWCSHQCFRQSRARRRASSTSRCRRTSSRARTASAQRATLHAELPPWKRRLRRCARCRLPDSLMCATRVTVALGVSNTPRVAQSSYARSPQAQRLRRSVHGVAVRAAARGSRSVRCQLLGDVARQAMRRCGVLDERVQPQHARPTSAAEGARRDCSPSAQIHAGRRRRRVHHVAEPCAVWAPSLNVATALPRAFDAHTQRRSHPVGRQHQGLPAVRNNTRLRHGSAARLFRTLRQLASVVCGVDRKHSAATGGGGRP